MKKILKYFWLIMLAWLLVILLINLYVLNFSKGTIVYDLDKLENSTVWLVFWARVLPNWIPSDILKDRLKVSIDAYNKWKISKILVSWDNSKEVYDEPTSMRNYLIKNWVDIDDIYLDYAWFDTYDSLYRAKLIFWIKDIVLFTQEYHLKRAIYISKKLWMNTIWMSTDLQKYIYADYYDRREVLSRVKAFLDVDILMSSPKYIWQKVDMSVPQVEISTR